MMDADDASGVLAILKVLDTGGWVDVNDTVCGVWADAMNTPTPIPLEVALFVAREYAATQDRFPTPKGFRAAVLERICGLPTLAAAEAEVRDNWKENYPGHKPKVGMHPVVRTAANRAGGLSVLRTASSDAQIERWWKVFRAEYEAAREVATRALDVREDWALVQMGEATTDRAGELMP